MTLTGLAVCPALQTGRAPLYALCFRTGITVDRPFHAYRGDEPFVFVSYDHEDGDVVYPEIAALHAHGFNIWYDEGISPGSAWRDELAQRIESCRVFLFFVSANSVRSSNCLKEVNLALGSDKAVLAVHFEAVTLPPGLRLGLSDTQAIHRFELSDESYQEALIESLGELVGGTDSIAERAPVSNTAPDDKSIAVVPLVNMSSDPENEYLSDGIAEELINGFSNIEGLRVASRMASFAYKGQADLETIGERLNVANILSGSVRKSGAHVRVTVQLSRAVDGTTLWSHRYDQTLEDIFDLQDDIARQVIDALKVELAGQSTDRLIDVGTRSSEAYEAYLLGHYESEKHTKDGFSRAIQLYEQATQYDDEFAAAYGRLGYCYRALVGIFGVPRDDVIDHARAASERARLLGYRPPVRLRWLESWLDGEVRDPATPEYWSDRWHSHLTSVIEQIRYPQHPQNEGDPLTGYGLLGELLNLTAFRHSRLMLLESREKNGEYAAGKGWCLAQLGRHAEAIGYYDEDLKRDHNNHFARHFRALDYARTGQIEKAEQDLALLKNVWGPRNFAQFCHLVWTGDDGARAYFDRLAGSRNFELRLKAVCAVMLGDIDQAVGYLEAGFVAGNQSMPAVWMNLYGYAAHDLVMDTERHPGFRAWREKIGFSDEFRQELVTQVNELSPIIGVEIMFDPD